MKCFNGYTGSIWLFYLVTTAAISILCVHSGLTQNSRNSGGLQLIARFRKAMRALESHVAQQKANVIRNFNQSDEESIQRAIQEGTDRDLDISLPNLAAIVRPPLPENPYEIESIPWKKDKLKKYSLRINTIVGNTSLNPFLVSQARRYGKYQERVPDSMPFPCNTSFGRSAVPPERADQVRPGDIDYIGAMGDSLTAGTGIGSTNMAQDMVMNRGLSALGGGQGSWREYLTLPNILKLFNPNLKGFGVGDNSVFIYPEVQHLNIAEPATLIEDLPLMTKNMLVNMKAYGVDMERDWKFISIFIGSNDFCGDLCFRKNPQNAPLQTEKAFRASLDFLMENFPRTIVAVIPTLHIPKYINSLNVKSNCQLSFLLGCPCVSGDIFQPVQKQYADVVSKIIEAQYKVAQDKKYRSKSDFAVTLVPGFRNSDIIPKTKIKGKIYSDARYIAGDCFHLSQRAHALGAANMWNILLSPSGKKQSWKPYERELKCPTESSPYIFL